MLARGSQLRPLPPLLQEDTSVPFPEWGSARVYEVAHSWVRAPAETPTSCPGPRSLSHVGRGSPGPPASAQPQAPRPASGGLRSGQVGHS